MRNIKAQKIGGRFRMLFKDVKKELNDVLNQYTFNDKADNLNDLKLRVAKTMDFYKDRMYKLGGNIK